MTNLERWMLSQGVKRASRESPPRPALASEPVLPGATTADRAGRTGRGQVVVLVG